ncbi:hypothetical protein ACFOEE_05375 [Pseudoalteromonas fenneropenaei]|uniref:Uncharacterized protein n=1 Tax=Pseudoalteromonas fenneropenaei TaxID=1737459 RepID=A0ABV7CHA5_9GAMM
MKGIVIFVSGVVVGICATIIAEDWLTTSRPAAVVNSVAAPEPTPEVQRPQTLARASANRAEQAQEPKTVATPSQLEPTYQNDELPDVHLLMAENQALQQTINDLKSTLSRRASPQDIDKQMMDVFEAELRDPQFADETELQIRDFLFQKGFSEQIEVASVGCKTTVCQFSFVPRNKDKFDSKTWRTVADSMFETEWWRKFQTSSSRSSDEEMSIKVSTKVILQNRPTK